MSSSINQPEVDIKRQLTISQPLCHSQLMVDKNELRSAFSARLNEALDAAGVRKRGRGVDMHTRLKGMGVFKTTQAISKWLNGEAIPEADSMAALSTWLKVRREWLQYGVLPKTMAEHRENHAAIDTENTVYIEINKKSGKVPLISWVEAGTWCEAISSVENGPADTWLSCPVPISSSGYALKVRGDSMTNPGPGRSYPAGSIIFIDPEAEVKTGDRVVARLPRTNEATFKVLVEDAGKQFLRPINPQYPIIEITEETHICGRVVGSFLPE